MFYNRLLFLQLGVLLALATLHVIALELALYWRFLWLDIIAHLLGGVWLALAILWGANRVFNVRLSKWQVLGGVVLVAIGWELFELGTGLVMAKNYALDTFLDLLAGLSGGYGGYVLVRHFFSRGLDQENKVH